MQDMAESYIPCVSIHARERQIERWGEAWPIEVWLDVARQILDRRAVLVRADPPESVPEGKMPGEVWLVVTPVGEVRVVWNPNRAVIATVFGPPGEFNTAKFAKRMLGHTTDRARDRAGDAPRKRARNAPWRMDIEDVAE